MNTGCSVKNFTFAADSENESATKKVYKRKVAKRKLQRSHAKPSRNIQEEETLLGEAWLGNYF